MIEDNDSIENGKHRHKIWQEQVRLIDQNAVLSNYVGVFIAILAVMALWKDHSQVALSAWLGFMILVSIARGVMSYQFSKQVDDIAENDFLYRLYLGAIITTAAGWGATGYYLFPDDPLQQIIIGFVIAGMSSGGVSVMTPMLRLYVIYLLLIVTPLMIHLFIIGGNHQVVALMILGYIVVMIAIGKRVNQRILNSLELRFHNESLIKFMSNAKNETEDLNEELADEIEQRKRVEKELKKAKEQAEAASKTKSEFLANMSHEIRTPMNGILGTLQILQDSELSESQSSYINIAYNSGESLLALLNDILDFSKIEAGKLELEYIPFNLEQQVNELCVLLKQKAAEHNVSLSMELDSKIPPVIKGDSARIRQILANLLTNAIKFTENGSVTVKANILELQKKSVRIRLEVIDSGIGISEEAQRRLFNSFTQADGSTTRKYGGTGLGLAIVRQLVTLMRGRLGVISEEGKGACFWVEIGFEIPQDDALPEQKKTAGKPAPETLKGHVLLVEDNPVNQVVAKKMLEKSGLTYEVVVNGDEAVKRIKQPHEFNLVLMDCQMPVMDGYEATQAIRQYEQETDLKRIPVVAMTANAMEGDKEKCLLAGMDDYVPKPVKQDTLKQVLGNWL